MQHMTAGKIAEAVGGRILWGDSGTPVIDICTDSRLPKGGELYVPILGERVDGHRFIEGALEKGAVATFTSLHDAVEELPESVRSAELSNTVWIRVGDTRGALQMLGKYCRSCSVFFTVKL